MFYLPDPNIPTEQGLTKHEQEELNRLVAEQFAKQHAEASPPATSDLRVINPDGSLAATIKNIGFKYEMGFIGRRDAECNLSMLPTEVSLVLTSDESHGYTVRVDQPAEELPHQPKPPITRRDNMNLGPITNHKPMWSGQSTAEHLTEQEAEALAWQEQADRDERDLWIRFTRCIGFATALLHYMNTTPDRALAITLLLVFFTCRDLGYILAMIVDQQGRQKRENSDVLDQTLVSLAQTVNSKQKRRIAVLSELIADQRADGYFYRDTSGRRVLTEGDEHPAAPRFTYTEARDYTPVPPDATRDYMPKTVK